MLLDNMTTKNLKILHNQIRNKEKEDKPLKPAIITLTEYVCKEIVIRGKN